MLLKKSSLKQAFYGLAVFCIAFLTSCEKKSEDTDTSSGKNSAHQELFLSEMLIMDTTKESTSTGYSTLIPEGGSSQYRDKHPDFKNVPFFIIAAQASNDGVAVPIPGPNDDVNDYSLLFTLINNRDQAMAKGIPANAYYFTNKQLDMEKSSNVIRPLYPELRQVYFINSGEFTFYPVQEGAFGSTPDGVTLVKSLKIKADRDEVKTNNTGYGGSVQFCHFQYFIDYAGGHDAYVEAVKNFNENGLDTGWVYIHNLNAGHTYDSNKNGITPPPQVQ